ncbi:unnamed protein product [Gordionus sp. m RMFG-2023]|uniref:uncharacterized protein LOC135926783 n=1 Tax=Gordionus sp. m RMFG-2023 TaxID=3053472 RepID=UPI0030E14DDF
MNNSAISIVLSELETYEQDIPDIVLNKVKLVFWFTIFPLFIILGIFGNLLNLITLFSGGLKGVAYIYLKWMAVADLSVNLLAIPWALENFVYFSIDFPALESKAFVTFLCRIDLVLLNGFMKSSVLLVIALTVERYIAVCHPVRYKVLCTDRRAKIAVIISFLIAFAISLPLVFQYQVVPKLLFSSLPQNKSGIVNSTNSNNHSLHHNGKNTYQFTNTNDFNIPNNLSRSSLLKYNDSVVLRMGKFINDSFQDVERTILPTRYTFDTHKIISDSVAYNIGYVWFKEIFLTFLPICLLIFFNFRIAYDFGKIVKKRKKMFEETNSRSSKTIPRDQQRPYVQNENTNQNSFKRNIFHYNKFTRKRDNYINIKKPSISLNDEKYNLNDLPKYSDLKETNISHSGDLDNIYCDYETTTTPASELTTDYYNTIISSSEVEKINDGIKPLSLENGSLIKLFKRIKKGIPNTFNVDSLRVRNSNTSNNKDDDDEDTQSSYNKIKSKKISDKVPTNKSNRQHRQNIKIKRKFQNERRLIILMVSVVLLFLVCILPAAFISIFFRFEKFRKKNSLKVGMIVSDTLEICNYSLNFYLYCFCSSDIRKALKKSLKIKLFTQCCNFLKGLGPSPPFFKPKGCEMMAEQNRLNKNGNLHVKSVHYNNVPIFEERFIPLSDKDIILLKEENNLSSKNHSSIILRHEKGKEYRV